MQKNAKIGCFDDLGVNQMHYYRGRIFLSNSFTKYKAIFDQTIFFFLSLKKSKGTSDLLVQEKNCQVEISAKIRPPRASHIIDGESRPGARYVFKPPVFPLFDIVPLRCKLNLFFFFFFFFCQQK